MSDEAAACTRTFLTKDKNSDLEMVPESFESMADMAFLENASKRASDGMGTPLKKKRSTPRTDAITRMVY